MRKIDLPTVKACLFSSVSALALVWTGGFASAEPTGGVIAAGNATISQSGAVTTINQSSPNAVINWQGFSVGRHETVNFQQPSVSAATLNRVTGGQESIIAGSINANGRVFLVNPAGVLFTNTSQVNVGGIVASTRNITDKDFMAGNYQFSGDSTASVINKGHIHAASGGFVVLMGNVVKNDGVISARLGTVAMAAGERMTLNFGGNALLDVTIDKGAYNALVANRKLIVADGGRVILSAQTADQIMSAQVNNTGIIQARTLADLTGGHAASGTVQVGQIQLLAKDGTVKVGGTLDASAPKGGKGGSIDTSGKTVQVASTAHITTRAASGQNGTWLIDPDGFTIAAYGGDISGKVLSAELANNNVTIASTNGTGTDGNITVNDGVMWSANTLTLNATNNIVLNAVMTASGSAGFAGNYGHALDANGNPTTMVTGTGYNADGTPYGLYTAFGVEGVSQGSSTNAVLGTFAGRLNISGTGRMTLNGQNYTVIDDAAGFLAAAASPGGNYVLGSDIQDLSATNWSQLGTGSQPFSGNFNGLGHVLYPFSSNSGGLFGNIGNGATVSNIAITFGNVTMNNAGNTGILADVNNGTIANSFVGGGISSDQPKITSTILNTGILVGLNGGLIANSYATGYAAISYVSGGDGDIIPTSSGISSNIGGLVGRNSVTGVIRNSFSSGDTDGYFIADAGGLVGVNAGIIDASYATGLVGAGVAGIGGGLVGDNQSTGIITNSYTTAAVGGYDFGVEAASYSAGFAATNEGTIKNAYAAGQMTCVTACSPHMAGFVYNNSGTISSVYTAVTTDGKSQYTYANAFSSNNTGTIVNSYWLGDVDPITTDGSGTGNGSLVQNLSGGDQYTLSSYGGFDTGIWGQANASGYPILQNLPVYVSPVAGAAVYGEDMDYLASDLGYANAVWGLQGGDTPYNGALSANYDADLSAISSQSGVVNAGTYAASLLLSASPYTNIQGAVTISPRPITLASTGVVTDKTYDGTTNAQIDPSASGADLSGLVGSETLNVNYESAVFSDRNAGTDKNVIVTYVLSDGSNGGVASNYTIGSNITTASITPAYVEVANTVSDKVYDGSANAAVTATIVGGVYGKDQIGVTGTGTFSSADAGTNKAVTITDTLTGNDSANYQVQPPDQMLASVTPRSVELGGSVLAGGTTVVPASALSVANLVAGDSLSLSGSVVLASPSVGLQSITDFSNLTLSGSANYTLAGAAGNVALVAETLPHDPTVVSGSISSINTDLTARSLTVNQGTEQAIINWQGFSIAPSYSVIFNQPDSAAITLNRVTGDARSVIAGSLTANGRIFLINPAGVMFTAGSSVNVGAIVASTQDIADSDFTNARYLFGTSPATGALDMIGGSITAVGGTDSGSGAVTPGYVALIGNGVTTRTGASMTTAGGEVLLVGGEGVTLALDPATGALTSYTVAAADKPVSVGGTINLSSATGAGGTLQTAGLVSVDSGLNVSTAGANGYGPGSWLWQSDGDFAVTPDGGALTGTLLDQMLSKTNVTLSSASGNIVIGDAVSWAANTLTLSSNKDIDVDNVMSVTGSGGLTATWGQSSWTAPTFYSTANNMMAIPLVPGVVTLHGINMGFGKNADGTNNDTFAGRIDFNSSGAVQMGVTGGKLASYTVINTVAQLAAITGRNQTIGKNYVLGSDIDLNSIADWTPLAVDGGGYTDILSGAFNGFGHVISNLTSTQGGLFLAIGCQQPSCTSQSYLEQNGASVSNLGLTNITIAVSGNDTGALGLAAFSSNPLFWSYPDSTGGIASVAGGIFTNVFTTGNITVSRTPASSERDTSSPGTTGSDYSVGGLFGAMVAGYANNTYSTVNITSTGYADVGSWAGATAGFVENSYAKGNVNSLSSRATINSWVGGFTGSLSGAVVNSQAYGNVSGSGSAGGFAGMSQPGTYIFSSKAYGDVYLDNSFVDTGFGNNFGGGFIGWNYGTLLYNSSSGKVTSATGDTTFVGGFSGATTSGDGAMSIMNAWNTDSSGMTTNGSGNGIPEGMGGNSTPILNAFNTLYGTSLTPAQFHQGAVGLTASQFSTVATQSLSTQMQSLSNVMNGGQPVGSTGGNNSNPSGGGSPSNGQGTGGTNSEPGGNSSFPSGTSSATNPSLANIERLPPTQRQAVRAMGNIAAANTVLSQAQPMPVASGMVGALAMAAEQPPLADHITIEEPPVTHLAASQPQDRRRPAPEARPSSSVTEKASAYDASIRSIEVDGQRFDLQATPETHTGKRH
ncbi:beta strand repeat-containing protein [Acetobacter sp.]